MVQFVVFLPIVLGVVGAWQYYVWTRLVRDPSWPEPYGRIATVGLVLMVVLPPFVIFGARFLPRSTVGAVSATLYTWFGLAFLLTVAFFAADLARWILRGVTWLLGDSSPDDPERRHLLARGVAGAAADSEDWPQAGGRISTRSPK